MNAVVALGGTSSKLAELRSLVALLALRMHDPDLYRADAILDELLPATLLALELAGLTRDEPERCALYDTLRDYLEAPRLVPIERLAGGGIVA